MKIIMLFLGNFTLAMCLGCQQNHRVAEQAQESKRKRVEVAQVADKKEWQDGDLIFQTSLSGQSKAIQLATKSRYSHCGLIFKEKGEYFVWEAVQPVKKTRLADWIARGEHGQYVVKRLKNAKEVLTEANLLKMKQIGQSFLGKNYDDTFEWTDEKLYCSELIWKMYQRATGIEIGKLAQLQTFDLTHKAVKAKLKERYGNQIPKEEMVISPSAIFESEWLEEVKQ